MWPLWHFPRKHRQWLEEGWILSIHQTLKNQNGHKRPRKSVHGNEHKAHETAQGRLIYRSDRGTFTTPGFYLKMLGTWNAHTISSWVISTSDQKIQSRHMVQERSTHVQGTGSIDAAL